MMRINTILLLLVVTAQAAAQLPHLKEQAVPSSLAELAFEADTNVGLVVHPAGCLLMADRGSRQVVCADLGSGVVRRIGRRGAGPGEFGAIGGIAVLPGGAVVVQDLGNSRLALLNPDWSAGTTVPLVDRLLPGLHRSTRDSVFALADNLRMELLAISLRTGGTTKHFSPGSADSALFSLPQYRTWGFFVQPAGLRDWFVASLGPSTILRLDGDGNLLSRADRDVPPELPSAEEREARRAQVVRLNPGLTPEQVRGLQARVDQYSSAPKPATVRHGFLEDDRGRLWVITPRIRSDSTELDVFDRAGRFLGTRRVPGRAQSFTRLGNDLLILGEYLSGPLSGYQGIRRFRLD